MRSKIVSIGWRSIFLVKDVMYVKTTVSSEEGLEHRNQTFLRKRRDGNLVVDKTMSH